VSATTVVPVQDPEAQLWRTTMTNGLPVGLAYTELNEHPLHPDSVLFEPITLPKEPSTFSSVLPVHVALGMPAVAQVEAARLVNGGTITTQSTGVWPAVSAKLEHGFRVVPEDSGPGGGGANKGCIGGGT
jgi:hypothetical protein